MRRTDLNRDVLINARFNPRYKICEKYRRQCLICDWCEEKRLPDTKLSNYMTIGTKENKPVLIGSLAIPAIPFAVGILTGLFSFSCFIPLIESPATESVAEWFAWLEKTGNNGYAFSGEAFELSYRLLGIPAIVTALSLSRKAINMLIDSVNATAIDKASWYKNTMDFIKDLMDDSKISDHSLDFGRRFIKSVDLKGNPIGFNRELLGHLAHHRHCIVESENGKMDEEEVNKAFAALISFLYNSRNNITLSRNYKKGIKPILEEYQERVKDFQHSKAR